MTGNRANEKSEFIIVGYILQAVMNDLRNERIPFEFGERSESETDFFQVVLVNKNDTKKVDELLAKYG
jgi:hypothetical protein